MAAVLETGQIDLFFVCWTGQVDSVPLMVTGSVGEILWFSMMEMPH